MTTAAARALLAVTWLCLSLISPATVLAQGAVGVVDVRVATADGAAPTGAVVDVMSATAATGRSAPVSPHSASVSLPAHPPLARVRVSLAGFQPAECLVTVVPGGVASVDVQLSPVGHTAASTAVERDRLVVAHQTTFSRLDLERLPSAATTWSLLETAHPFLISDRIDGGGQWPGEGARLGGQQGGSAAQTTFRLDGHEVGDPLFAGVPSIDPALAALDTIVVQSAALDASAAGPGPVVDLVLRQPSALWSGDLRVNFAPPALQSGGGATPPITRLKSGGDGDIAAGGPLGDRLSLFLAGRAASAERIERAEERFTPAVGSAMGHLVALPRSDSEFRAVVAAVWADRPFAERARFADRTLTQRDGAVALHAGWEQFRAGALWTIGAAFQRATSTAGIASDAAGGIVERLRDGPPLDLVAPAGTSRTQWDIQAGFTSSALRWLGTDHVVRVGASAGGAGLNSRGGPQPAFAELVNGVPARVWDVTFRGDRSQRGATSASAFVSERIALSDRVTLAAAIRADIDRGSATGAATGIRWFTATPRVTLRWRPADRLVVTSGYAWYGHQLPLSYLAVGDPSGPAGVMSRWDDRDGDGRYGASELTAVAAVGACCTPAGPGVIDESFRRPVTGEFRVGFEQSVGSWRWGVTGLDRRERHLAALVNTGVTTADYVATSIDDPGIDIAGRSGVEPLPIFDRTPASFLRDAYRLTNTAEEPSRYQGLEVTLARDLGPWLVRFGGSAYLSEGVGADRGYRADENDQGLLGEVFTNPNATTHARGRLFYDRAFVMKVLGGYQSKGPLGAWFVARYQDGQPFARVVVADGLNQGPEVVQAYARGGQRFTYTLTLDARVALLWNVGHRRKVGLAVEAFNLPDMQLEVEEDIATGPAFRTVTAVQPPRVVRIGLQLAF
jgi:hypothetical protein